jgi:hypothetical protein
MMTVSLLNGEGGSDRRHPSKVFLAYAQMAPVHYQSVSRLMFILFWALSLTLQFTVPISRISPTLYCRMAP